MKSVVSDSSAVGRRKDHKLAERISFCDLCYDLCDYEFMRSFLLPTVFSEQYKKRLLRTADAALDS